MGERRQSSRYLRFTALLRPNNGASPTVPPIVFPSCKSTRCAGGLYPKLILEKILHLDVQQPINKTMTMRVACTDYKKQHSRKYTYLYRCSNA